MKQTYIIRNLYLEHEMLREQKNHERKLTQVHSVYNTNQVPQQQGVLEQVKEIHSRNHRSKLIQSQYDLNKYNQKILNRLVDIASGDKNELNQKNITYRQGQSLNQKRVKTELNRINDMNEKLAKKLITCESNLNFKKLENDYNQQYQYKNLAIKFREKLPALPSYNSKQVSMIQQNSVRRQEPQVKQSNSLDETQIISQIRDQLAGYQILFLEEKKMKMPSQTQQDNEDQNKDINVENNDNDIY